MEKPIEKDICIKKDLLGPFLAFKLIRFTEIETEASVLAGVPVIRHGPWAPPPSRLKSVANKVLFWGKGGVRKSSLGDRAKYLPNKRGTKGNLQNSS